MSAEGLWIEVGETKSGKKLYQNSEDVQLCVEEDNMYLVALENPTMHCPLCPTCKTVMTPIMDQYYYCSKCDEERLSYEGGI